MLHPLAQISGLAKGGISFFKKNSAAEARPNGRRALWRALAHGSGPRTGSGPRSGIAVSGKSMGGVMGGDKFLKMASSSRQAVGQNKYARPRWPAKRNSNERYSNGRDAAEF